jgi:NAD(P)-dependent dehydrogenase (short-subunit alcohol dehydrogenase family)
MGANRRSILVTGCSDGGLGAALAVALHNSGQWRVIASARNVQKMQTISSHGIETLSLDVTSEESLAAAKTHLSNLLGGRLDGLLLNAGGGLSVRILRNPHTANEHNVLNS